MKGKTLNTGKKLVKNPNAFPSTKPGATIAEVSGTVAISKQKTPKVIRNKILYANKGLGPLADKKSFKASAKPTPGMGKGKSRGGGAASYGTKFEGVF